MLTSSAVNAAGSRQRWPAAVSGRARPGRRGRGVGVSSARARRHAVTPWRVSTARPSGNASRARAGQRDAAVRSRASSPAPGQRGSWPASGRGSVQQPPGQAMGPGGTGCRSPSGLAGGWVSRFWTAAPGSGPAPVRSSGGARARRSVPRSADQVRRPQRRVRGQRSSANAHTSSVSLCPPRGPGLAGASPSSPASSSAAAAW